VYEKRRNYTGQGNLPNRQLLGKTKTGQMSCFVGDTKNYFDAVLPCPLLQTASYNTSLYYAILSDRRVLVPGIA